MDGTLRISGPRRRVPILALLAANAVSETGNVLAFVAIPWFVLQTTGSAVKTGLTGAVFLLAAVMAGVVGGPVVDRLGFKRASIVADLVGAAEPRPARAGQGQKLAGYRVVNVEGAPNITHLRDALCFSRG